METWRAMEQLVEMGLVKHIGTSNVTVPKLSRILRDARIKPALNEMELHPTFQQGELFQYCLDQDIVPIGYSPIGSPGRPERDPHAGRSFGHGNGDGEGDCGGARDSSGIGVSEVGGAAGAGADPVYDEAEERAFEPEGGDGGPVDAVGDGSDAGRGAELPADQGAGISVAGREGLSGFVGYRWNDSGLEWVRSIAKKKTGGKRHGGQDAGCDAAGQQYGGIEGV